jgi:hypothetical protein
MHLIIFKEVYKEYANYNKIIWGVEKGVQLNLKEKLEVLKVAVQNVLQL